MDLTTPDGVTAYMKQSTSDEDWNRRTDMVKKANGGQYPSFWWSTVIASGLSERVSGNPPALSVTAIDKNGSSHDNGTYHAVTGERLS